MSTDVSGRGRGLITHIPRCALVTLHGGMDTSCMGGHSSACSVAIGSIIGLCWPPANKRLHRRGPRKSGVAGIGLKVERANNNT